MPTNKGNLSKALPVVLRTRTGHFAGAEVLVLQSNEIIGFLFRAIAGKKRKMRSN